MKTKKYTRENYFAALALDTLSSHAHGLGNMLDDCGAGASEELAEAMADLSSRLHKEARELFPRYPHDDHIKGLEWARKEGLQ
jgi:hypothetical protein